MNREVNEDGATLTIFVSDNGIGIAKDKIAQIFDSFYQVSSEKDGVPAGYGIGLALTKKLVEIQGGSIHVQSQEGQGTSFEVQIPCAVEAKNPHQSIEVMEPEGTVGQTWPGHRRKPAETSEQGQLNRPKVLMWTTTPIFDPT